MSDINTACMPAGTCLLRIAGDGNCLIRCILIALALENKTLCTIHEFRQYIVNMMYVFNLDAFSDHAEGTSPNDNAVHLGHAIILTVSMYYLRKIVVYKDGGTYTMKPDPRPTMFDTIELCCTGDGPGTVGHYDLFVRPDKYDRALGIAAGLELGTVDARDAQLATDAALATRLQTAERSIAVDTHRDASYAAYLGALPNGEKPLSFEDWQQLPRV